MPKDVFASALRGALVSRVLGAGCSSRPIIIPLQASPGQDCTSPYPSGDIFGHIRHSHSMYDLSEHNVCAAEATDSPNQPSLRQTCQPNVADVVPPNHGPAVSPLASACTLHRREARVPLSTSAANIRAASHSNFDEPSEDHFRRISASYDWLFNAPLGQRTHDFGAETLDLVGPDPFRWVPTRAHVSEVQKALQVPESTASGALRLATSTSHDQMPSNSKVKRVTSHDKRRQKDVWWDPQPSAFIENRASRGEGKGKVQTRQIDSNQYPQTRL
jgi:hypothetical protein